MTKQHGFTLLEVLLAVSITAMIGIGASQLLSSTVSTKNATDIRAKQLRNIQRMDFWLKRDLWQIAGRVTKDIYGNDAPIITTEEDYDIEFTHSGLAALPFGDIKRSNLQRVAYAVRSHESDYCKDAVKGQDESEQGQCLVRIFWPVLDLAPNSEPIVQVVLDQIEEVRFFFRGQLIDQQNPINSVIIKDWQEQWPSPYMTNNLLADLAQIKVEITTKQLGQIERWYEVPRYAYTQP
ncbi:MAG: type II secretion system minor pseudopilin GspJ [Bermanella sp.]